MEEIFSDKFQYINLEHYNIYHFEELVIEGRRYQFRLSSKEDLMTVVTHIAGRAVLLVSVWTNMDYEKRLKEIHQYIMDLERSGTVPADFRIIPVRHNNSEFDSCHVSRNSDRDGFNCLTHLVNRIVETCASIKCFASDVVSAVLHNCLVIGV
ncbi:unnamed protein product [Echinostoma caproni]|uniref:Ras-related GTP-binding protein n=1 Tax=Echinostoma caproni TaxID=27848 RepID=A0A183AJM1_9TREM|nr:unnamed protein product [Echinostoma caproni]